VSDDAILNTLLLVFIALLCFCCYMAGAFNGVQDFRTEAVERGFAEWVPDKEGNTTFRWKEVAK